MDSVYRDEISDILNGVGTAGQRHVYLEGDFSESCKLAMDYSESEEGYGMYSLLFHSCHHYSIEILAAGQFDNPVAKAAICGWRTNIPVAFYGDLMSALGTGIIPGSGMQYDGEKWNYIGELR